MAGSGLFVRRFGCASERPYYAVIILTLLLGLWTAEASARETGARIPADPDPPTVPIPRLDSYAVIDGVLNENEWSLAASLEDFFQFLPVDGRASEDSTVVLVWYAPTGIHFGIRAYETHDAVRATLADRDKVGSDDYVQILLDTFDDQRQAVVIGVNPFGIQSDGVLRDVAQQSGSFFGGGSAPYRVDLNPDYVYQSKGRLTPFGYEVEVFVPFKSLRYQSADVQDWGINIIRRVQHSGYTHTWTPALQANASFLSQSGKLTGLHHLNRGLVLDLSPETTSSVNGIPDGSGWNYRRTDPQLGGNLRWGITNNLILNATANPDFSQIDADVAQFQFDPRQALFFPEKRPFFLDGIELFQSPQNLIFTRNLANPIGALKLTGKLSGTQIGLLSGIDRKSTSLTGNDHRIFNAIRLRRDLSGQSSIGIAYTDKVDGDHSNRVGSVFGRMVFNKLYTVEYQLAESFTSDGNGVTSAPLWLINVSRSGRRFGITSRFSGIHGDFRAETGFIGRTNVARANISPRLTVFGKEGSLVESWNNSISLDGTWDYDRFTDGKEPNDAKLHINTRAGLRGGWSVGASVLIESFKYPSQLYQNFFVERTVDGAVVDTVAYTGTDRLNNLDYVVNFSTPRFDTFSLSGFVLYGQDENFFEWSSADILVLTMNLNWTPTDQIRVNLLYNHQQFFRKTDRSIVQIRRTPRLKVEYQLTRSIFVRLVGQYDANLVDKLRDDSRTNDDILIQAGDGSFIRPNRRRTNNFRVDGLFSYRPTPGTVLFLGYGSSLQEPDSFKFSGLDRISDGFFMKFSYLFRV